MPDREAQSLIVPAQGRPIETAESVEELVSRFAAANPFAEITDLDGVTHFINSAHVVEISEPPEKSGLFD